MLIELGQILAISGKGLGNVLHVGAHLGEEVGQYIKYGASTITLVEQDPLLVKKLVTKFSRAVLRSV